MIRGIAGIFDVSRQDDVAQDVWLKLVAHPPKWLAAPDAEGSSRQFYGFLRKVVWSCVYERWKHWTPQSPAEHPEATFGGRGVTISEFREAVCHVWADLEYPHRTIVFLEQRLFDRKPAEFPGDQKLALVLKELVDKCIAAFTDCQILDAIRSSWEAARRPLESAMHDRVRNDDYAGPAGALTGDTVLEHYRAKCAELATCIPRWTEFVHRRLIRKTLGEGDA
jgi:hypothetical protein